MGRYRARDRRAFLTARTLPTRLGFAFDRGLSAMVALLLPFLLSLANPAFPAEDLTVRHARIEWVPGLLPNRAFFELVNNADRAVTLTGAKSPTFARVEFKAPPDSDIFILEPLDMPQIIGPKATLKFHPEGPYLFLHVKGGLLEPGTTVIIKLLFEEHGPLAVEFPVRKSW